MVSNMGVKIKVLLCICLLGLVTAEVNFGGEWVENQGWHVTCSWETLANDTLQSVRMYRNDIQFLIYRPETHGLSYYDVAAHDSFVMTKSCIAISNLKSGRCKIIWEPILNVTEDTYRCEVSGERPTFRIEEESYSIFAPPSDAVLKQIPSESDPNQIVRPTVNCTSSGLPPPRLLWTVKGQKIPEDFTHTTWNSTSKLWDSWSSYNPQDSSAKVLCTPEVVTKTGRLVKGLPAVWNRSISHDAEKFFVVIFSSLAMLYR